jgi:hypothetical protein
MKRFPFLLEAIIALIMVFILVMVAGINGILNAAELEVQQAEGPHPTRPVVASSLDFTWTAGDPTEDATFTITGKELLLMRNLAGTTQDVTIETQPILGRTADIEYAIGAGEFCMFWYGEKQGYADSNGVATVSVDSSSTEFALVQVDL